jgi:MFS family permease
LGGFIVDRLSWQWIFYINVIPGLLAGALVAFGWRDRVYSHERPAVDYTGAGLLSVSVFLLLLGLMELGTSRSGIFLGSAFALFLILVRVERRAADPILPVALFRDNLFSTANGHGFMSGWAVFGTISFIPLFVQSVLGASPTRAGITITPMLLGWVGASIFGTRILLKVGYRRLSLMGSSLCVLGALLMTFVGAGSSQTLMMIFVTMIGIGMGLSVPAFVIAVQTTVERRHLGAATSMLQFSRSMGGTLGVSVMGAALSVRLASNLNASGLDPSLVAQLLDPAAPGSEAIIDAGARFAMANAIHLVFLIAFIAAALALVSAIFTPRKELTENTASVSPATAD